MRESIFGGVIALACALSPSSAFAASGSGWTGNELLATCRSAGGDPSAPTLDHATCLGYITGVYESFGFVLPDAACAEKGVTNGQLVDIVVKFLILYPEKRNRSAPLLIAAAVADAFPCPAMKQLPIPK